MTLKEAKELTTDRKNEVGYRFSLPTINADMQIEFIKKSGKNKFFFFELASIDENGETNITLKSEPIEGLEDV